jgi:hypothetical protein
LARSPAPPERTRQFAEVYTATGGDTQVLGNFEYRIPIVDTQSRLRSLSTLVHPSISVLKLRKSIPLNLSRMIRLFRLWLHPCPRLPQQFAPINLTTMAACQNFTNLALSRVWV